MNSVSASGKGSQRLAQWSLRLLGGFELCKLPDGGRLAALGKRERVLLAYLALSPNGRQGRRKLATLLWGDASDATALDNLRNCLWAVRKALGDTEHRLLASEGEDIELDATAFDVDAVAFRQLAAQSGRAELEAAAALYSGEFLDGLGIESEEFETWRRSEAARSRDCAVDVLMRLMTQLGEAGETERAIEMGLRIMRLEPLHEAAVRRLMHLYGESGRRGAALQLYRTLAEALRIELDAEPEADTRAVFADVSRGSEERTTTSRGVDFKPPRFAPLARTVDEAPAPVSQRHAFKVRGVLAALAGAAVVTIAVMAYQQKIPGAPNGVASERAASANPATALSIAVLPFLNLSADSNQEFFSDGMTEEITAALAKVHDLKVVARSSAFEFRGENQNTRSVGQALNATHLVEGSVRKEGNRVRITAQLIDTANGTHLWTESYDRELSDIFAAQEEIARTIVVSLMAPLGLAPGESLVFNRGIDPESYQQFLRARTILRNRGGQGQALENRYAGAIGTLEQIVARDRSYAPAWALLAMMSSDAGRKETAAREAIRLDSGNAAGYGALAQAQNFRGNFAASEDLVRRALALDPNEPEVLDAFSLRIIYGGRIKEALSLREKLRTLEPFIPTYNIQYANILLMDGQNQAAIAVLQALPAGAGRNISLAHAYAAEGRYGEAADMLLATPVTDRVVSRQQIEDAARLLRSAPTKVKTPETLPVVQGQLSYVYAYIGALDRGLDEPERVTAQGKFLTLPQIRHLWSPEYAPIRKTERFKALMRAAKTVDYWRATRWADRCRPIGADDFVCD